MNETDTPNAQELSLREAAERLGVHYMTAYRHVRTGRLPARQVDGHWRVDVAVLDLPAPPDPAQPGRPSISFALRRGRMVDRLVAGDEAGAWSILEEALMGGADPVGLHVDLLAGALGEIGERWAADELPIADEHRATALATRLVGRLGPRFVRRGRRRGTVVLAAAPDDHHALPVAIAADVVRAARYAVVDLGGAVPADQLAHAVAGTDALVAVGICTSVAGGEADVAAQVAAVREISATVPILLGGSAANPDVAEWVGADGYGVDARHLVDLIGA